MLQEQRNAQRWYEQRVARANVRAHQRLGEQATAQTNNRPLVYVLIVIFVFQALLLGCATVFLGTLVLFNGANLLVRAQELERFSTALNQITPVPTSLPPTDSPTATPMPPSTLEPTATVAPIVALPTQTPTIVPGFPLPTPTGAAPAPEVQAYLNQALAPVNTVATTVGSLTPMLQTPNLNDPLWVDTMRSQLTIIRSALDALQLIQAPPTLFDMHNGLLNALTDCRTATTLYASALDNRNSDSFINDSIYFSRCTAALTEPTRRLQELMATTTATP
ncbi:MAG: hypothetical protein M3Q45_11600 [Chloroflexota bacterium]|nr:hypothetical protein [Chloroflexota bacterium]